MKKKYELGTPHWGVLKKLMLMTKLTAFLVLALSLNVFATVYSQNTKLNLDLEQTSIKEVLQTIESQSDFRFIYENEKLNLDRKVNIQVAGQSVTDVLNRLFADQNVDYTITQSNLIIIKPDTSGANKMSQQARDVNGKVTDTSGAPLPGVSIIVKGSTKGTVTDMDGNFALSGITPDVTLVFSFIGMEAQEFLVGNQRVFNVTLKEETVGIEEVVAIGYTTKKKADLTGAVSSVKIDDIRNIPVTGLDHAMQGKMAGVTVYQNSGAPGASASVRIRGIGTIGENDPLYVVDGMPVADLNDINPNNIERIDVLKDAAAAAIYGSRAANGVVLVQTKKGAASNKINVTFNTHHGWQRAANKVETLSAADRNMIHKEAYENSGQTVPDYYSSSEAQITRTNWQDEILEDYAYTSNYDVGISGGDEKAKYNVSAGHMANNGILKNTDFKRTTFRINTSFDLTDNVRIGENLLISKNENGYANTTSEYTGALFSALVYHPDVPVYNSEGELSGAILGGDVENPVGNINRRDRNENRTRIFGNAYLEWDLAEGLKLKTDMGYDWTNSQDKWFVPRIPEEGRKSDNNELTEYTYTEERWISTTTLTYNKSFGKHNFDALLGTSLEASDMEYRSSRVANFISEDPAARYPSAGTEIKWYTGGREEWSLLSYFARLDYNYNNRYLLSLNLRGDASSKFSEDNRWGWFPSFSAGWRISEEAFFEGAKDVVSNLKLRGSWGQLGNQNIGNNYPLYTTIRNTTDDDGYNVVFGSGETPFIGRYEDGIVNQDIQWEVTTQSDIGFDISFLDNRLELIADYYKKKSSDILLQVPITSLAGVNTAPWVNAGEVENKGFEMSLTYQNKGRDFHYSVTGNFSTVQNEVTKLGEGTEAIYGSSFRGNTVSRTIVGEPIAHFFGLKTDGIFASPEEVSAYKHSNGELIQPNAVPGDIKFVDIDGNGMINADDRTNIGDGFPDFTYGLNFSADYKNFDLSLFMQGVQGYEVLNGLRYTGLFVDPRYNQMNDILGRWTETNTGASIPRVALSDPNGNRQISDFFVEDADYLRLKTLTVGYTLPKSVLNGTGIDKLRFYFTGQNLLTFTNYSGFDPEIGESFPDDYGVTELGVDRGQYPQPKTFILGLNINF